MSKGQRMPKFPAQKPGALQYNNHGAQQVKSLIPYMKDFQEYQSILRFASDGAIRDLQTLLHEIESIRGRRAICYLVNTVNQAVSDMPLGFNGLDHIPFSELLMSVKDDDELDIILVTPGGLAETVDLFVAKIRERHKNVSFIIPYMAMSAGTIFCMSGDEIIMGPDSYIGPIDPQVKPVCSSKFIPAQSILETINTIKENGEIALRNGEQPAWTDIEILRNIDAKDIGIALEASKLSSELVIKYLVNYRFANWNTKEDGNIVTETDKVARATKIATTLCAHQLWKSHGRGISAKEAENICDISITHLENNDKLWRAVRRFWALACYLFDKSTIFKLYLSNSYLLHIHKNVIQQQGGVQK